MRGLMIGGWIAATFAFALVVGVEAHQPRTATVFDPPEGLLQLQHGMPALVADSRY